MISLFIVVQVIMGKLSWPTLFPYAGVMCHWETIIFNIHISKYVYKILCVKEEKYHNFYHWKKYYKIMKKNKRTWTMNIDFETTETG